MTLMRDLPLILILVNMGITPKRQSKLSEFWMTHPSHWPLVQPLGLTNMLLGLMNMLSTMIPLTMKSSGHILVGLMLILFRKSWNTPPNGESPYPIHSPMTKHLKSRNPALNIPRRHEPVAADTVFSDTSAVDSGVKQAQVFVCRDTLVADAYLIKSGKQVVNTLQDNIRRRGAMDKLLSDSAKTEISIKVMDILRAYHLSNWHSEPYHQNQKPTE